MNFMLKDQTFEEASYNRMFSSFIGQPNVKSRPGYFPLIKEFDESKILPRPNRLLFFINNAVHQSLIFWLKEVLKCGVT